MERSAMRMFSSSANCARIPPAALLVEPDASASRSRRTTSPAPSLRRWKAVAAPRAPPPITTTSAELTDVIKELAERRPVAAGATAPLDQDLLLDGEVVRRGGLQPDPGKDERILARVEALVRLHEARPRRGLARVLEGVDERPALREPVHHVRVAGLEARQQRGRVLRDDGGPELDADRARLRRERRAVEVARRHDPPHLRPRLPPPDPPHPAPHPPSNTPRPA